jgi:hypothetical protein
MCFKKKRAVLFNPFQFEVSIPVVARSVAWVCGRSLAGIVGSNPAGISVSCECFVLFGKGLCVGLITRPEECYRVWGVYECDIIFDNEEALAY